MIKPIVEHSGDRQRIFAKEMASQVKVRPVKELCIRLSTAKHS